jgi:hypothetical protein
VENKQADNKKFNMFAGSAGSTGFPFIGSVFEDFGLDLRRGMGKGLSFPVRRNSRRARKNIKIASLLKARKDGTLERINYLTWRTRKPQSFILTIRKFIN